MFKCALNRLAQSLEREVKKGNIPESLSMATKLDILSRTGLVEGILNTQSEKHKQAKQILNQLCRIQLLEGKKPTTIARSTNAGGEKGENAVLLVENRETSVKASVADESLRQM